MGEVHLTPRLTLLAAVALLPLLAACGGSGDGGKETAMATPAMTPTPGPMTPVPAQEGDVWGPFIFSATITAVAETPPPVGFPSSPDAYEGIPYSHPGYRQFATAEEMAAFAGNRAQVLVPAYLPAATELLAAWAVELEPAGRISDTGLEYRVAGSQAFIGGPDIIVWASFRDPRPSVWNPSSAFTGPGGQVQGTPQRLIVRGYPAVYTPLTNPRDLPLELQFSSSLNWFDDAGVFWAVQGRNLDLATLVRIAESLQPVTPGGG